MPVFIAKLSNLIGWGEVTSRRGKGWCRNKFKLKLDGHAVTIVQRRKVLKMQWSAARGRLVESSTVRVAGIKTFEEGRELVEDMCALISFAMHTRVVPYEFAFGTYKSAHSIAAACNQWRAPFGSGIGKLTEFVMQAWLTYRAKKQSRALGHLIHMITMSDAEGAVFETQVTVSMQCLESIKSYFAISEGTRFGIREEKDGKFVGVDGKEVSFKETLKLALREVGMTLPPTFPRIVRLRNAIIHRGFIRESDQVTRYIFGPLSPGAMFDAMFATMEHVQDILREFVFRLLNYKGSFRLYADAGSDSKTLT
jgi:hypothetical protein